MVDIVDRPTRSRMMSGIRSKDTGPEKDLRKALHALGLRFSLHRKDLPGRPDIVLSRWNAVIEVRGCFWHRHQGCSLAASPDDPTGKWTAKFQGTVARDRRNERALRELGWRVAIVWECAIRAQGGTAVAERVRAWLASGSSQMEIA